MREEPSSWATPLVIDAPRPQTIVPASVRTRSYDLASGKLLWEAAGMTMNVVPSPIFAHGMVYLTSGFRGNSLQAIRPEAATGEITGTDAIAWTYEHDTPDVSPSLWHRVVVPASASGADQNVQSQSRVASVVCGYRVCVAQCLGLASCRRDCPAPTWWPAAQGGRAPFSPDAVVVGDGGGQALWSVESNPCL